MTILSIKKIKPGMLVIKLGLRIKEYKYRYTVTAWERAAEKVEEFYQAGDKITLPLVVRLYKDRLVLNAKYPPRTNTGTKKGNVFRDVFQEQEDEQAKIEKELKEFTEK